MTQKEFENIMELIKKEEKGNNLEDLIRLRDYLTTRLKGKITSEEKIFIDPLLESKKEILLKPMVDYFDEIKQMGPHSATYPLKNVLYRNFLWKRSEIDANFAVERTEQRPGQILLCLAHFIQLKDYEVRKERGVGKTTFHTYQQFLEEKGLSLGTEISKEENQRIVKYLIKTTQSQNTTYHIK